MPPRTGPDECARNCARDGPSPKPSMAPDSIPAGQTASYAEVAARIGRPAAVRAVARACATNPVAVIVPCHRVVKTDGALSGYRWGVERKRRLLKLEGASPRG